MSPVPQFQLRQYIGNDVLAHFDAVCESIDDLSRWLPWCHPGYSILESASWVLTRHAAWNSGDYTFVVEHLSTRVFVGSVGLTVLGQPFGCANLGYWVRSGWHRRGAASAAIRDAAQFGFAVLGLQRIEILAAVGNVLSQRAASKAGAQHEGVLRRRLLLGGRLHDAAVHSLVPDDLCRP